MQFDLKRARELLIKAEENSFTYITVPLGQNSSCLDHFLLLILSDVNFVEFIKTDFQGKFRLKSAGLDFLQRIRDPEIWDALLKSGSIHSLQQVQNFLDRNAKKDLAKDFLTALNECQGDSNV